MRFLAGAAAGLVGLAGMFWSANSEHGEPGYPLGLLISLGAVVVLFLIIKSHYDAVERGGTAKPKSAGTVAMPRFPQAFLALLPDNVPDNMVLAMLAGILSLGGGIVATYNTGFGWAFGMLMFFGFGAAAAAMGWKIWTIGFIDDDRQDA